MMSDENFTTTPGPHHKIAFHFTGLTVGLLIVYILVAVTAIVSNLLILLAIFKRAVPHNTVNVFLSSLAFSDLLMVLLSLFDFVAFVCGEWVFGEWTCKFQSFLLEVSFSASTFTLVSVSCERYLLICFPNKKRRTMSQIKRMVMIVWAVSLCICSPLLDGYNVELDTLGIKLVCANKRWIRKYQQIFYGIYSIIVYLLPLFVMAFAHWRISRSVKPSQPEVFAKKPEKKASICFTIQEESSASDDRKQSAVHKSLLSSFNTLKRKANSYDREKIKCQKRMKAIRLLFAVTVTFFLLWTPFIIFRIVDMAGYGINYYLYKFSEVLIFSSTAVNGFIYAFMSLPFRNSFKALMTCNVTRDFLSRDSAPSYSNSEDNRIYSKRPSNFSGYNSSIAESETRSTTLNRTEDFKTAV